MLNKTKTELKRTQTWYQIRNRDLKSDVILALPTKLVLDVNILFIVKAGRKIGNHHLSLFWRGRRPAPLGRCETRGHSKASILQTNESLNVSISDPIPPLGETNNGLLSSKRIRTLPLNKVFWSSDVLTARGNELNSIESWVQDWKRSNYIWESTRIPPPWRTYKFGGIFLRWVTVVEIVEIVIMISL